MFQKKRAAYYYNHIIAGISTMYICKYYYIRLFLRSIIQSFVGLYYIILLVFHNFFGKYFLFTKYIISNDIQIKKYISKLSTVIGIYIDVYILGHCGSIAKAVPKTSSVHN